MLNGALWMIALRWAIRLTGLVSTVILARLLMPSDFGIVAMAMIVVSTLEIFKSDRTKLGADPAGESHQGAFRYRLDGVVPDRTGHRRCDPGGFALGGTLFSMNRRSNPSLQCLALRAILGGLENIGTVNFRRESEIQQILAYNVYPKLISFTVTVALAFMLRNYWALVAGILIGQLALIVLSYVMHPHRPRFTLSKVREIWSFSIWTFFRSVGYYINGQIDQIVVGGFGGAR